MLYFYKIISFVQNLGRFDLMQAAYFKHKL